MKNLALDSGETQCNNFENLKANLYSTDIFTDEASDPDIKLLQRKTRVRLRILLS